VKILNLRELKRGYSKAQVEDFNGIEIVSVNKKHLKWLFEQAEKVEKLRLENLALQEKIAKQSGRFNL
jgi:hypothetical protein